MKKIRLRHVALTLGVAALVLFGWEAHRVVLYAQDIYAKAAFYDEQYGDLLAAQSAEANVSKDYAPKVNTKIKGKMNHGE